MNTPHVPVRARAATRAARLLAAALAVATVAVVGPSAPPAGAAPQTTSSASNPTWWAETQLFNLVNSERWWTGRTPLHLHDGLGYQASAWSIHMGERGQLSHHPDLSAEASRVTPSWSGYGEIVGRGPDVASVLRAFMASPPHRAQILGDHTAMGVGIIRSGGQMWVTVRFIR